MVDKDAGIFIGPNDGKVLTNPIGGRRGTPSEKWGSRMVAPGILHCAPT